MLTRILSAALLAPLAIVGILCLPTHIVAVVLAAIMLLALWEWIRLCGDFALTARLALLALNALTMVLLAWYAWPHLASAVSLVGMLWWLVAAGWAWRWRLRDLAEIGTIRPGVSLIAGSLAVIPAWAALLLTHSGSSLGPRWALFALSLVWLVDIGAFLVGSRLGRRKLAPNISPNKTWEGFWGGMVAAALGSVAALPLLGLEWSSLPALLVLASVTALFAVLGDLFESLLKRVAHIKDSGHVIPGHGGMLDRIDSMLAALPAFVIARIWLDL